MALVRHLFRGSLVAQQVKNLPANKRGRFNSWVRKSPWRRSWLPPPVFLPGESHGQRRLAGYRPQGHKESYTTEATEHTDVYLFSKCSAKVLF